MVAAMNDSVHARLPSSPRWTHIALMVEDIDATIAWYADYTPLGLLEKRQDEAGWGAWLGQESDPDSPFILVLAQFLPEANPWAGQDKATLGPFAHIGIEMPTREAVDEVAARADTDGILTSGPVQMPSPIGYVCFVSDPDGNTVEFSYDQGVFAKAHELWGGK